MAKNAILGNNLVDKLAPTVGKLRSKLYPAFGVRQFKVFLVRRRWDGGKRGAGTVTVTQNLEMDPRPAVEFSDLQSAAPRLMPGGMDEATGVTLTEVDLRYAEAELTGRPIREDEEFLYRLEDGHGQLTNPRYYEIVGTPYTDRDKDIGWVVNLHEVEIKD